MVGVRMSEQDRIELRKGGERDPRAADPGKKSSQSRVEVGIGEQFLSTDLN
jgi:hypothetical protein